MIEEKAFISKRAELLAGRLSKDNRKSIRAEMRLVYKRGYGEGWKFGRAAGLIEARKERRTL